MDIKDIQLHGLRELVLTEKARRHAVKDFEQSLGRPLNDAQVSILNSHVRMLAGLTAVDAPTNEQNLAALIAHLEGNTP